MLKKLVMEFKDELDALGVKVDKLDKRVAVLEDNLGGWKLTGSFRFDARFGGGDRENAFIRDTTGQNKNSFSVERWRFNLTKQIDENTSFRAEYRSGEDTNNGYLDGDPLRANSPGNGWGVNNGTWYRVYVDTKLPYDINFRVGRFTYDWEADAGLYTDNDALFGDITVDGFQFNKAWGTFAFTAVVGRNLDQAWSGNDESAMNYAANLGWTPNEKFFGGLMYYAYKFDDSANNFAATNGDLTNWGIYAGFNFTPSVALKGAYYKQSLDWLNVNDDPAAWKAILDVKQDLLKFTDLWIEYGQQDNTFLGIGSRYRLIHGGDHIFNRGAVARALAGNGTTKFLFVRAGQKWNDKWSTQLRYAQADFDTDNMDTAKSYSFAVDYQYTPAIQFELGYDHVDHGNTRGAVDKDETNHVVFFRTNVSF